MKVECINFGEARAYARTRGGVLYRNIREIEDVKVSKFLDAGPTCWARRKFEIPALEFEIPALEFTLSMGVRFSKPHALHEHM